ncbi:malate transporter [Escherichia coli]|nr:malate transporter [Escherichia coli]
MPERCIRSRQISRLLCEGLFHGKKFCEACGTGIYCRATCTKYVYRYQPDLYQDCGGALT